MGQHSTGSEMAQTAHKGLKRLSGKPARNQTGSNMTDERLTQIERMFRIGTDLAEKVVAKAQNLTASDAEEYAYKGAMFFFFCKAYKSYQGARLLFREGFPKDAFVLARTIFEISLQAQYMQEDPKPRARLFVEHDPVARYRYYEQLKKIGDTSLAPAIEIRKEELVALKEHHDRLQGRYPKGKGWWGNSIAWLAKHLGKNMEMRYAAIYWMQSNLVHTGAASIKDYLDEQKDGLKVNCYAASSNDVMGPQEATLFFLNITRLTSEALALDLSTEVGKAFAEFQEIVTPASEASVR